LIAITTMLCAVFNAEAQDTPVTWGAKAGANLTSYGDHLEVDGHRGFDSVQKQDFI